MNKPCMFTNCTEKAEFKVHLIDEPGNKWVSYLCLPHAKMLNPKDLPWYHLMDKDPETETEVEE